MLNSEDLINKVKVYNKFLNLERLNKAYNFAVKAHSNQKRASGDPYSVHPIEVANILTDLKLDSATITTGLLHESKSMILRGASFHCPHQACFCPCSVDASALCDARVRLRMHREAATTLLRQAC